MPMKPFIVTVWLCEHHSHLPEKNDLVVLIKYPFLSTMLVINDADG
jgi:hypothetical protein